MAISTIFSSLFPPRKRKTIKRERREALGDDLTVDLLTGADIKSAHWDAFFAFYIDTSSRKWGRPYLTREFFDQIGATMAERILLVMARRGDRHIAGAINFLGEDAIYGRNWGAIEERPFLHFEVCYYQAIEFAIRHGYKRVEAGAQGEHKLARGYRPVATHSAHEFAIPRLAPLSPSSLQGSARRLTSCSPTTKRASRFEAKRKDPGGRASVPRAPAGRSLGLPSSAPVEICATSPGARKLAGAGRCRPRTQIDGKA